MSHPFKDKLVVFIGRPQRCKRKEARDALVRAGGIPDEQITAFTSFAVAFDGADGTKAYQKASKYSGKLLSILTEAQFFDILEEREMPPEMPKRDDSVIVIPAKDSEAQTRESEEAMKHILNRKRMNNLARHGVQTPDGRVKIDMRPLDTMVGVMKIIKEREEKSNDAD